MKIIYELDTEVGGDLQIMAMFGKVLRFDAVPAGEAAKTDTSEQVEAVTDAAVEETKKPAKPTPKPQPKPEPKPAKPEKPIEDMDWDELVKHLPGIKKPKLLHARLLAKQYKAKEGSVELIKTVLEEMGIGHFKDLKDPQGFIEQLLVRSDADVGI